MLHSFYFVVYFFLTRSLHDWPKWHLIVHVDFEDILNVVYVVFGLDSHTCSTNRMWIECFFIPKVHLHEISHETSWVTKQHKLWFLTGAVAPLMFVYLRTQCVRPRYRSLGGKISSLFIWAGCQLHGTQMTDKPVCAEA